MAEFAARRQQGESLIFEPELLEKFKAELTAMIKLTPDGSPDPEGERPTEGPPETTQGS